MRLKRLTRARVLRFSKIGTFCITEGDGDDDNNGLEDIAKVIHKSLDWRMERVMIRWKLEKLLVNMNDIAILGQLW